MEHTCVNIVVRALRMHLMRMMMTSFTVTAPAWFNFMRFVWFHFQHLSASVLFMVCVYVCMLKKLQL